MRYFIALLLLALSAPAFALSFTPDRTSHPFTYKRCSTSNGGSCSGAVNTQCSYQWTFQTGGSTTFYSDVYKNSSCAYDFTGSNDYVQKHLNNSDNYGCPANSTISWSDWKCSPNSGYSAVNDGSGSWSVAPSGSECTSPKVYNATTGTCDDPPPASCDSGDSKILTQSSGLRDAEPTIQTWDCVDGCEYKIDLKTPVHECFSLPESFNPDMVYCSLTYKSTGESCTQSIISFGGDTSGKTPESSTPTQSEILNNPPPGSPTSGSSPTTTASPASQPNKSGGGGGPEATYNQPPTMPTDQAAPPVVVAGGCDGCSTESTQREVHKALTDSSGLPSSVTDPTDDRNAINVENVMVGNDTIQALFHIQVPAHTSECPTAEISIETFRPEPYVLNSHCDLIQPHESTLRLLSTIAWIIMAALIILQA